MQNRALLGSSQKLWDFVLRTVGVQAVEQRDVLQVLHISGRAFLEAAWPFINRPTEPPEGPIGMHGRCRGYSYTEALSECKVPVRNCSGACRLPEDLAPKRLRAFIGLHARKLVIFGVVGGCWPRVCKYCWSGVSEQGASKHKKGVYVEEQGIALVWKMRASLGCLLLGFTQVLCHGHKPRAFNRAHFHTLNPNLGMLI